MGMGEYDGERVRMQSATRQEDDFLNKEEEAAHGTVAAVHGAKRAGVDSTAGTLMPTINGGLRGVERMQGENAARKGHADGALDSVHAAPYTRAVTTWVEVEGGGASPPDDGRAGSATWRKHLQRQLSPLIDLFLQRRCGGRWPNGMEWRHAKDLREGRIDGVCPACDVYAPFARLAVGAAGELCCRSGSKDGRASTKDLEVLWSQMSFELGKSDDSDTRPLHSRAQKRSERSTLGIEGLDGGQKRSHTAPPTRVDVHRPVNGHGRQKHGRLPSCFRALAGRCRKKPAVNRTLTGRRRGDQFSPLSLK
ncbi:hypothetical protein B0H16DRAFT_1485602 [Mycena metata]|uniref:Uncharacterized protein n=1 Tax=Mycena metata TaxID=1033252 RepID=A0AAD7DMJ5_9AGAR|nr:hypothetical protein B0H16DRAFT_1485602 [Mycena metata]